MAKGKEANKGFFEPCWVPVYSEDVQTKDNRDLRDPQGLGESLLYYAKAAREAYSTPESPIPMSEVYDVQVVHLTIPNVSGDDSMGKQCVREYRAELEARKAEGDKYASSALEAIDQGRKIEYDDPAGN